MFHSTCSLFSLRKGGCISLAVNMMALVVAAYSVCVCVCVQDSIYLDLGLQLLGNIKNSEVFVGIIDNSSLAISDM